MSLSVATWNVEWAAPNSRRTAEILRRIDRHAHEVVCLTETDVSLLSKEGHTIKEERRKVLLWSREPWDQVDDVGIDSMPPGRFVSGVIQTSMGEVTVVGICIPWFGSPAEARRKLERKTQWEDHAQYLAGLIEVLGRVPDKRPIVMGYFNQTIGPGNRAGPELRLALYTIPGKE